MRRELRVMKTRWPIGGRHEYINPQDRTFSPSFLHHQQHTQTYKSHPNQTKNPPKTHQKPTQQPTIKMKFIAIPVFALLATGALAMPSNPEAPELATRAELEARANCKNILPACNGGKISGKTNCRCKGQKETCDLWTCPGGAPNVVCSCSTRFSSTAVLLSSFPS